VRCPDVVSIHRQHYRQRLLSTLVGELRLVILKLPQGSFLPDWLVPRRRIVNALYALVMEVYTDGIPTRKVDSLAEAPGGSSGIFKSEVSRICAALYEQVKTFLGRSLDRCTIMPSSTLTPPISTAAWASTYRSARVRWLFQLASMPSAAERSSGSPRL
jgi:hypothetical protein